MQTTHIVQDADVPERELLALSRAACGGADSLWPANHRWLTFDGPRPLAHVSVQRRWFVIDGVYFEGWFVGGVCTDPAAQRRGLASALLRRAEQDLRRESLGFAVLNCGESRCPFYERLGYARISDRALYLRGGGTEIDEDPVLALRLKDDFDVAALICDPFPFGVEF